MIFGGGQVALERMVALSYGQYGIRFRGAPGWVVAVKRSLTNSGFVAVFCSVVTAQPVCGSVFRSFSRDTNGCSRLSLHRLFCMNWRFRSLSGRRWQPVCQRFIGIKSL